MIKLINRSNLHEDFPKSVPALERALSKTSLGDYWNLEQLVQHIINYEVGLFWHVESGYFGVFQFTFAPLAKSLNFFWSGKDPANEVPVDYSEVDQFLDIVAREQQCHFISCEGRRGWKPILEARGNSEDSVLYTKKVNYELPDV